MIGVSVQIPRKTLAHLLTFSLKHGLRDPRSAPVVIGIFRRVFSKLGSDQMEDLYGELADAIVRAESNGKPIGDDDTHEQWIELWEWLQGRIDKFR